MFYFDPLYLLFAAPALILALWAQAKVKSAFARYSQVGNSGRMSGAEAAAHMLHGMGLRIVASSEQAKAMENAVAIEAVSGFMTDHYDPRSKVLRLSPQVYEGRSVASVGVACHEAGHALQHANGYAPLELRNMMVPVAQFGSPLAVPLILLGLFFASLKPLIMVGLLLFTIIVFFQIVTLPVEFNASRRAKKALLDLGIIRGGSEAEGVSAVLDAAAMTYVAAAVSAIMTLLYYLYIIFGSRR